MADKATPYTLYHNRFSICSMMVRYTLAIRGKASDQNTSMVVEEREVDIYHGEQLREEFLYEINPKGQVPVLCHPAALQQPICESLNITTYIMERYPGLAPKPHEEEIARLLKDLHAINYFSLTFATKPQAAVRLESGIVQALERGDISDRYREALKYKLEVVRRDKTGGIQPSQVEVEQERAKAMLSELNTLLAPGAGGPWLFGEAQPTALDAHTVVFLARLQDVGRGPLIPPALEKYAAMAVETAEWQSVFKGGRTMTTL